MLTGTELLSRTWMRSALLASSATSALMVAAAAVVFTLHEQLLSLVPMHPPLAPTDSNQMYKNLWVENSP